MERFHPIGKLFKSYINTAYNYSFLTLDNAYGPENCRRKNWLVQFMGIDWTYWPLVKIGEPPTGVQPAGERLGELSNTNPDGFAGQEICSVPPPRFAKPSAGGLTTSMG